LPALDLKARTLTHSGRASFTDHLIAGLAVEIPTRPGAVMLGTVMVVKEARHSKKIT